MQTSVLSLAFVLACAPFVIIACGGESNGANGGGAGAAGGTGGTGAAATTGPDPGYLEECKAACQTYEDTGCPNREPLSQCQEECDYYGQVLDGLCSEPYIVYYQCITQVDFVCNADGQPTTADDTLPCTEEYGPAGACLRFLSCEKYCRAAEEAGCGGESHESCVAQCRADDMASGTCYAQFEDLRYCEAEKMACENGQPAPAGCDEEKADLAACSK